MCEISLAGAATSIIFVPTKVCSSRQNFCHEKRVFVATNICCNESFDATKLFCRGRHNVVVTNILLRQKMCFVATKDVLLRQTRAFVVTKMTLVAALANDTFDSENGRKGVTWLLN